MSFSLGVIPAKAGTHSFVTTLLLSHLSVSQQWIPAFAGMTKS
jgi:hypothetical protein